MRNCKPPKWASEVTKSELPDWAWDGHELTGFSERWRFFCINYHFTSSVAVVGVRPIGGKSVEIALAIDPKALALFPRRRLVHYCYKMTIILLRRLKCDTIVAKVHKENRHVWLYLGCSGWKRISYGDKGRYVYSKKLGAKKNVFQQKETKPSASGSL